MSRPVNVTSATAVSRLQMGLTEIRRAIPVQLPPVPIVDSIPYEASAPRGVDKLKYAMCFRHSERGRELDIRDMDNASAVGAKDARVSLNPMHKFEAQKTHLCVLSRRGTR